jgi:hypothetical protein
MIPTADPYVFIEEQRPGYWRYHRTSDDARWEIFGYCDMRGDCLVGSVNPLLGPPETRLDVPVTPEFSGCCPLKGRYLDGD